MFGGKGDRERFWHAVVPTRPAAGRPFNMSSPTQPTIGRRTTESLRALACNAATQLRDGIERVLDNDSNDAPDAPSDLVSLCGNLDELDSIVRHTIGTHPRPIPADLVELHARIEACVDAAVDLAAWAFDKDTLAFSSSASKAFVKIQHLLAFVDPTGSVRASSAPPGSVRPRSNRVGFAP
jgi:hypothetical protein